MYLGNILVTGGLGFIGSHFIRHALRSSDYDIESIVNIDYEGYGSNIANLKNIETDPTYFYIKADINDREVLLSISKSRKIDTVVNFAAETHVDRSISTPTKFIKSNINGAISLLEFCRTTDVEKFIQISTDEVYGDATGKGSLDEYSQLNPNNPYSASKASADLLVRSYNKTYGLKTIITRCSNNFGPNQFPEKLIPKTIIRTLKGLPVFVYGDGLQTREWLYVKDHVNAVLKVIERGHAGEIYNISTQSELTNIELIERIGEIIEKEKKQNIKIQHVQDRPGHDRRYSLNSSKISKDIGWKPSYSFEDALKKTIKWYIDNESWWAPIISDAVLHPQPWQLNWDEEK